MSTSLIGNRGPAGKGSGQAAGSGASGNVIPKGYKYGQLQQFTPEQTQLFQQMFSHVSPDSYLSKLAGGDESAFAPMEERANRDFQGALGQLGSRFSGLGMGAQRGSGFKQAGGQLASDFALDLSSRRQGLQRQALQDLMGLSESLLGQRPQDRFITEKPKKFWQELSIGGAQGVGQAAAMLPFLL